MAEDPEEKPPALGSAAGNRPGGERRRSENDGRDGNEDRRRDAGVASHRSDERRYACANAQVAVIHAQNAVKTTPTQKRIRPSGAAKRATR